MNVDERACKEVVVIDEIHQSCVLQAQDLNKAYGQQRVLEDIALSVEAGAIVGLLGGIGAGKSSLLECLLGLSQIDSGELRLLGKSPQALNDRDRSQLAYVPQEADGFSGMTVAAMFECMAKHYPQWDARLATRLKKAWNLDGLRRLGSLLRGERQLAALIRAVAARPRLLVLDEPASALEPSDRLLVLEELASLVAQQQGTLLFSTHLASDLACAASHVAWLHQGRLRMHEALEPLKRELRRVVWPLAVALPEQPLAGEFMRRRLDADHWVLVVRDTAIAHAWPAGVRSQRLSLQGFFVELTL